MRAAERASGASEWELMQRAGAGAAEWIWRIAAGRAVTVLCGPGNNGGDGYVLAEVLRARGLDMLVIAPLPPTTDPASKARARYRGEVRSALDRRRAPILVDALFGFGLSRAVSGPFADLLDKARAAHDTLIAIDVPSGVNCDTGQWLGKPHAVDCTLALGAWKRAHWLMPASATMGAKRLVAIGVAEREGEDRLATGARIMPPSPDSHKYRRGLLAIVAGQMPGASLLAAEAALRAGAGYVKLASDHSHPDAPADLVIARGLLPEVLSDRRIGAVLVGPGLVRDDASRERLAAALDTGHPAVIDADALHLVDWDALEGVAGARLLLTPHEGELAALCEAFAVKGEGKPQRAAALRDATGASILAKGPDTVLAPAGGGLVFFPPASSWLSVAGTGDVLAGIAASRLAGHGNAALAAEEAVWLHRKAAAITGPGFTAGELARSVGGALAASL